MPFKNPHPLYAVWQGMRRRCLTPTYRQWGDYGGRGIAICERWGSFQNFVDDMGPRPKGYSLDRVDNDKGYSPENCRWATRKMQQRNRRNAVYVEIEGIRYRLMDLARDSGLKRDTIEERAQQGLSYDEVMHPAKRVFSAGLALGALANGARMRAKTHCKHGHEFTPENTYVTEKGWRKCRACHVEIERRRRDKRRA